MSFCSEERLPQPDCLQPSVTLHEELFYDADKHLLAIRMGPETSAGAESHCGRLSKFFGSELKQHIVNSSRVSFVT